MTVSRPYNPWTDPLFVEMQEQARAAEIARALAEFKRAHTAFTAHCQQWADNKPRGEAGVFLSDAAFFAGKAYQQAQAQPLKKPASIFAALWEPLQADSMTPANREGLAFAVKAGGAVTITPETVTLYGPAMRDSKTIETAVLQAVTEPGRGRSVTLTGGTAENRAQYWAFAQMHGLKVKGYKPTERARQLAATLTSHRTEAAPRPVRAQPPKTTHELIHGFAL